MKFNFSSKRSQTTTNYMGAKAYTLSPEMELYTAVATCMIDDSYYENRIDRLNRIKELIARCPAPFTAKLAVYARKEMNLRSIPVVLAVELAKIHSGDGLVSKTISNIVIRADEIKEVLAYYQITNERIQTKKLNSLSKQLQKGLALSFNHFDEYQFAKYNTPSAVKMKDALFLVHPKAKDEAQQEIFNKIAANALSTPYTWETELSQWGKTAFKTPADKVKALALKWEELVLSNRIGYMALLRNLRNIITKSTDAALTAAMEIITDEQRIKAAKQLPFRYLSAFNEVEKLQQTEGLFENEKLKIKTVLTGLESALVISCSNIPVQEGRTAILSDNSGSMFGDYGGKSLISAMSKRNTADIANLFAVLYWNRTKDAYIGLFGDRLIEPALSRNADVFENFKTINAAAKQCGGATERGMFDYMEQLIKQQKIVDRLIIFSDCQVGDSCKWFDHAGNKGSNFNQLLAQYKKINPVVKVYSVDLKGYGNTMVKDNAVLVSGWSEKIFDMIEAVEQGNTVVEEINKIIL
jgi:hypothetical protein